MTTSTLKQVRPCAKHGIVEREKSGRCKKCRAEQNAKSRKLISKEKRAKYDADYVARHPETRELKIEIARKWAKENPEKNRSRKTRWLKENPYSRTVIIGVISGTKAYLSCGLTSKDIPNEIVEIKRLQMQLLHAIKAKAAQQ